MHTYDSTYMRYPEKSNWSSRCWLPAGGCGYRVSILQSDIDWLLNSLNILTTAELHPPNGYNGTFYVLDLSFLSFFFFLNSLKLSCDLVTVEASKGSVCLSTCCIPRSQNSAWRGAGAWYSFRVWVNPSPCSTVLCTTPFHVRVTSQPLFEGQAKPWGSFWNLLFHLLCATRWIGTAGTRARELTVCGLWHPHTYPAPDLASMLMGNLYEQPCLKVLLSNLLCQTWICQTRCEILRCLPETCTSPHFCFSHNCSGCWVSSVSSLTCSGRRQLRLAFNLSSASLHNGGSYSNGSVLEKEELLFQLSLWKIGSIYRGIQEATMSPTILSPQLQQWLIHIQFSFISTHPRPPS